MFETITEAALLSFITLVKVVLISNKELKCVRIKDITVVV